MAIPNFLFLSTESEYKRYFVDHYCANSPLLTWDGLPVEFHPDMFEHAFYKRTVKSWNAKKDCVDFERCKRMQWIEEVLQDSTIVPRQGYDKARGRNDNRRRVVLVSKEKYVVIIRRAGKSWKFVTAYLIDNDSTYYKLMSAPVWVK